MVEFKFPQLLLAEWKSTRDILHSYARILGGIRHHLSARQKHWWHISLQVTASGLTTTPITVGPMSFELSMDLTQHLISITTNTKASWELPFSEYPPERMRLAVMDSLVTLGIRPKTDLALVFAHSNDSYDPVYAQHYQKAITQIDVLLKEFKGQLREESSPVQLWPHHFDLAMTWFSGRLVPGTDPNDEEASDESLNFGFSTGDEHIPDPYFYATAYPFPERVAGMLLPGKAVWNSVGWKGALFMYEELSKSKDPRKKLLEFFQTFQRIGSGFMTEPSEN